MKNTSMYISSSWNNGYLRALKDLRNHLEYNGFIGDLKPCTVKSIEKHQELLNKTMDLLNDNTLQRDVFQIYEGKICFVLSIKDKE